MCMSDDQDWSLLPTLAVAGFIVSGLLLVGAEDYTDAVRLERMIEERELTARYAQVLADCANGGGFIIHSTGVKCFATEIADGPQMATAAGGAH